MRFPLLLISLLCTLPVMGQGRVLSLDTKDPLQITPGAYYKDTDFILDKFVGLWKYEDGTSVFSIKLKKKVMFYNAEDNYYEDIIIGEYSYVANGAIIINTLPDLEINNTNQFAYNISSLIIKDKFTQPLPQRRIWLTITDPERDYLIVNLFIKYIPSSGQNPPSLEVKLVPEHSAVPGDAPAVIRVPYQTYIMVKQP